MTKYKKTIKIYFITFVLSLFFFLLVFTLGLEYRRPGGTNISGAIHVKSVNELWQSKYSILLGALLVTPLI